MDIQHRVILLAGLIALFTTPVLGAGSLSISSVDMPTSVTKSDTFTLTVSVSSAEANDASGTVTTPSEVSCSPTGTQSISLNANGQGTTSWSCTGDVAGDYTNEITISVSATDSGTGGSLSDSAQDGLQVLAPASLTASASLNDASINTDQTATFTVSVHNTGDKSTDYSISTSPAGVTFTPSGSESSTVSGGGVKTVEYTVSSSSTNTYSLEATVSSSGTGQSLTTDAKTLTVTAASNNNNNNDGDSGSGSGTTSGGGGFSLPTEAAVDITAANDTFQVVVSNAQANTTVAITLFRNMTDEQPGIGVDQVQIGVRKDGEYKVNVSSSKTAATPFTAPGKTTLGYLTVDHTFTDDDINNGTIHFRVNKSNLHSGIPENVVLHRYTGGNWTPLLTTPIGEEAVYQLFAATTPGFSTFAVVEDQPNITLTNAYIDTTNVSAGGYVTVTATATNTGEATGTTTLVLTIAGQTIEKDVTVAAGEQKTVTFTTNALDAGTYHASVNGASAGNVTVTAPELPEIPDASTGLPWALILGVLAVLIVGAVIYAFREETQTAVESWLQNETDDGYSDELGPVRLDPEDRE